MPCLTVASTFRVNFSFLYGFLCATPASLWPDAHALALQVFPLADALACHQREVALVQRAAHHHQPACLKVVRYVLKLAEGPHHVHKSVHLPEMLSQSRADAVHHGQGAIGQRGR